MVYAGITMCGVVPSRKPRGSVSTRIGLVVADGRMVFSGRIEVPVVGRERDVCPPDGTVGFGINDGNAGDGDAFASGEGQTR